MKKIELSQKPILIKKQACLWEGINPFTFITPNLYGKNVGRFKNFPPETAR